MIVFAILLIGNIVSVNLNDFSFSENKSPYLGIMANSLLLIAMIIAKKEEVKKTK
jgi:hypothetical protein